MIRGSRRRCLYLLSVLGLSAALVGCGEPAIDSAPFEGAIAAYLAKQSMGMKVKRFRELDVSGDRASASVSLTQADDAVGISVTWEFDFVRRGDAWEVSECRR